MRKRGMVMKIRKFEKTFSFYYFGEEFMQEIYGMVDKL